MTPPGRALSRVAAVAAGLLLAAVVVQAEPIDRAERASIMDAARVPVTALLKRPVLFKVERLHRQGRWVFLHAEMVQPDGRPVSYAGTALAADARDGMVSKSYAVLMWRNGPNWSVVANAIGPTDVPWASWAQDYGAPAQLFEP